MAAALLRLDPDTLRRILPPDTVTLRNDGLLRPGTLERLLPRDHWYTSIPNALRSANRCGCAFFDVQGGRCGLDLRLPADPQACEDYTP